MAELTFRLVIENAGAQAKLDETGQKAGEVKAKAEQPISLKVQAENALGTIRDLKIAFEGVAQVVTKVVGAVNGFLDAALEARQSAQLAAIAFGDNAKSMSDFAQSMQEVTNFEGDQLLALMAKMAQTYNLNTSEIQRLTPALLDFTEANKVTGMTVESAFDLMGRALNGHTEMLGRYGIELDNTRLKTEGVAYLVQTLGERYGGTATALADLRLQNANTWGDVKETIGDMLQQLINPLLAGIKELLTWFNQLTSGTKGVVAGLALAIPVVVSAASAITALSTAVSALWKAMNPVVGVISLVAGGLTMLGVVHAATSLQTDADRQAHKEFAAAVDEAKRKTDGLVLAQEALGRIMTIEGEHVKSAADRLLEHAKNAGNSADLFGAAMEKRVQVTKTGTVTMTALEEDFARKKAEITRLASLDGIAKLQYELQLEKEHYRALGQITDDNESEALSSWQRIKELEAQINATRRQDAEKTAEEAKKYAAEQLKYFEDANQKEAELVAQEHQKIEDGYTKRIELLRAQKDVGLDVNTELLQAVADYLAYCEKAYGKDSKEYFNALKDKQQAQEAFDNEKRAAVADELDVNAALLKTLEENEADWFAARLDEYRQFCAEKKSEIATINADETMSAADKVQAINTLENEMYTERELLALEYNFRASQLAKAGQNAVESTLAASMTKLFSITYKGTNDLIALFTNMANAFIAEVARMIAKWMAFKLLGSVVGAGFFATGGLVQKADGGFIRGPGTATSDSIPAMLSNGEYVVNAFTVKRLGTGFFDALNYGGRFPVPTPQLAFATGGAVGDSGIAGLLSTLITKVEKLTQVTDRKQLSVQNNISADAVVRTATPAVVNEINARGGIIRGEQ